VRASFRSRVVAASAMNSPSKMRGNPY